VDWRSYQESYFDSCGPFKDVVVSLMATLAKHERLRISERTKAGLQRAVRAGKVLGRPKLYRRGVAEALEDERPFAPPGCGSGRAHANDCCAHAARSGLGARNGYACVGRRQL
jgi:hypothetical protein